MKLHHFSIYAQHVSFRSARALLARQRVTTALVRLGGVSLLDWCAWRKPTHTAAE